MVWYKMIKHVFLLVGHITVYDFDHLNDSGQMEQQEPWLKIVATHFFPWKCRPKMFLFCADGKVSNKQIQQKRRFWGNVCGIVLPQQKNKKIYIYIYGYTSYVLILCVPTKNHVHFSSQRPRPQCRPPFPPGEGAAAVEIFVSGIWGPAPW